MQILVKRLTPNQPVDVSYVPDTDRLAALQTRLALIGLRKMRFEGQLHPQGPQDWKLSAHLGATVVQPCVVTLEPVTTRIEIDVTRVFLSEYEEPSESELEMPEDDSCELLGDRIDIAEIAAESLALALPDFPRSDGADLEALIPASSEDDAQTPSPFAALEELKDKLKKN